MQAQTEAEIIDALKAENAELSKQVTDLEKQVANKKDKSSKDLEEAKAALTEATSTNQTLLETIKDLKEKLSTKTAEAQAAIKEITVKKGNKTYTVETPQFNVKGVIIKAEDLHEHKDAIDFLIEVESEVLKEKK